MTWIFEVASLKKSFSNQSLAQLFWKNLHSNEIKNESNLFDKTSYGFCI